MNSIDGVLAAAAELEAFCRGRNWPFCFIGGIPVQRWGTPRFTQDVDATLLAGFGAEAEFVDAILEQFRGRRPDARQFALQHRVLLARTAAGVDLDIALGALPFEERAIRRATQWKASDAISINTCSAEDLIVHKTFAARDRDWGDIESVLVRQHGKLDLVQIRAELSPLLEMKEDMEPLHKLERIIAATDKRLSA